MSKKNLLGPESFKKKLLGPESFFLKKKTFGARKFFFLYLRDCWRENVFMKGNMYLWRENVFMKGKCIYEGENVFMKEKMCLWKGRCIYEGENVFMKEKMYLWRGTCIYEGENVFMKGKMYLWRENVFMKGKMCLWRENVFMKGKLSLSEGKCHTHTHSHTHTHTHASTEPDLPTLIISYFNLNSPEVSFRIPKLKLRPLKYYNLTRLNVPGKLCYVNVRDRISWCFVPVCWPCGSEVMWMRLLWVSILNLAKFLACSLVPDAGQIRYCKHVR